MGYTAAQSGRARQKVNSGDIQATGTLDATTTSQILVLATIATQVTFQAQGTLAGTIEFSLDGINWKNSTAIAASNAMATYNTHLTKCVRVTRSGGTGTLTVAAK